MLAVKHTAKLVLVGLSAAVALIASLGVIVFTNDMFTLLYLVAVFIVAVIVGVLALLLAITVRRGRKNTMMAGAAFGAFLIITSVSIVNQGHIRPHLLWLIFSQRYKSEVLATAARDGEFKHVEWDGDGWGSGATGDWMGYVVFDPSDYLSAGTKSSVPAD
jgi:hypothetical protein